MTSARSLPLFFLAIAFLFLPANAQPLFQPLLGTDSLLASATGNSVHVIVGSSGTLLVSSNAVNWIRVTTVTNDLNGVAFGAGRFIAIARDGLTLVSTTGMDWSVASRISLPKDAQARGIAFANTGGGLFAAVDSIGRIFLTATGANWTQVYQSTTNEEFVGIASNGTLFAAAGNCYDKNFDDRSSIRVSNGLEAWSPERNALHESLQGISWVQDKFMAVGSLENTSTSSRLVTSANGVNWSVGSVTGSAVLYGATYGAGYFWLLGEGGTVLYSPNGTRTWKAAGFPSDDYSTFYGGFANAAGNPVLFGDRLMVMATSGSTWVDLLEIDTPEFKQLACGNGKCVAVSDEHAWVSSQPNQWIPTRIPFQELGLTDWDPPEFTSVAFGNGVFVAVGFTADPSGKPHSIAAISYDGLKWAMSRIQPGESMNTILYAKNNFVAGGSRISGVTHTPQTWQTANGTFWPNPPALAVSKPSRTEIRSLAANSQVFIATGTGGALYQSTDGAQWLDRSIDTKNALESATFAAGRFHVVSEFGEIWRSQDGTAWEPDPEILDDSFTQIVQGANRIIGLSPNGRVWASPDGVAWQMIQTPTGANLNCGIFDGKQFIVAGTGGTILTSPDGLSWTRVFGSPMPEPVQLKISSRDGQLVLEVAGKPGSNLSIESSPNLGPTAAWTSFQSLKLSQTNALVPVPMTPGPTWFIRAKAL